MGSSVIVPGGVLDQGPDSMGGRARLGISGLNGARTQARMLDITAKLQNMPQTFVLSFSAVPITQPIPVLSNHRIFATICWGSLKSQQAATFDLKHGTRLTLEGTQLTVDGIYTTQAPGGIPADGPDYDVTCSIGAGSVGKGPTVTFTDEDQVVNVGASVIRVLPRYARQVEIQSDGNPFAGIPPSFLLSFLVSPVGGARVISTHAGRDVPITIPNGAEAIQITNNGPGIVQHTPIYHLSL